MTDNKEIKNGASEDTLSNGVSDHTLSNWASRNSQESQNHSITSAAYQAWFVPIILILLISFFPFRTNFISLNVEKLNFRNSNFGVQAQSGPAINKRILTIENKYGGDILDFVVNFEYANTALTEIVYTPPPGVFADVYKVGELSSVENSERSFRSSLGIKNLKKGQKILVGLIFKNSIDGFKYSSITGKKIAIWNGLYDQLFNLNFLVILFGVGSAILLVFRTVSPYLVNNRTARFLSQYIDEYVENVRTNPSLQSPVGRTIDDVYSEVQKLITADGKDHDLIATIAKHKLATKEPIEIKSSTSEEIRVMVGPFNIVGHPTFRKRKWFRNIKFLVFHIDQNGKIVRWTYVNVHRIIKPVGDHIQLETI